MRPISAIRRENLASLVAEAGGQAAFAGLLSKDKNQVYQWLIDDEANPQARNMKHATARLIERVCDRPEGWLDVERSKSERTSRDGEIQSAPVRPDASMMSKAYTTALIYSGLAERKLYLWDARHMDLVCEIYGLLARGEGVLPGEAHTSALTAFARRIPNITGGSINAVQKEHRAKR